MHAPVEKPKENKSRAVANSVSQKRSGGKQGLGLVDNRTEAKHERSVQLIITNAPSAESQSLGMGTPSGDSSQKVAQRNRRGAATIQARLDEESEAKFRAWIRDKLPTLPGETVAAIIDNHKPKGYIAAIKEAKDAAQAFEQLALQAPRPDASVQHASRSLADELLDSYPPGAHHYILLGNSPAVLRRALTERDASFSDLPLGGLTDAVAQEQAFGRSLRPGEERGVYAGELRSNEKLQTYLGSYLEHIRETNLVVIDFTQSGGSAVIAADLLTRASEGSKTVKLFTFSHELPDDESLLATQTDYDLVSAAPLGSHERTFVTLTDTKAYKNKLGLKAYESLTLAVLNGMEDANYESVLKQLSADGGLDRLNAL